MADSKLIAKNTLLLYFRMIFNMLISLYTSRVILNALGVEDFGIYNVVGGVVIMFGFLHNAMAASTERFIAYGLGKGNDKKLSETFSLSVSIHVTLSIIVFILLAILMYRQMDNLHFIRIRMMAVLYILIIFLW